MKTDSEMTEVKLPTRAWEGLADITENLLKLRDSVESCHPELPFECRVYIPVLNGFSKLKV